MALAREAEEQGKVPGLVPSACAGCRHSGAALVLCADALLSSNVCGVKCPLEEQLLLPQTAHGEHCVLSHSLHWSCVTLLSQPDPGVCSRSGLPLQVNIYDPSRGRGAPFISLLQWCPV